MTFIIHGLFRASMTSLSHFKFTISVVQDNTKQRVKVSKGSRIPLVNALLNV